MNETPGRWVGRFCWADLAAADLDAATGFYTALLGLSAKTRSQPEGTFRLFASGHEDIASVYQLRERHLAAGVPSHWTPYFSIADAEQSAGHASALGATVVVPPFTVRGMARIALIQDPVGATFGLWEQAAADNEQD